MQAFTQLDGLVAPLDRANVDTDAIIPKQFLKSIKRAGFGPNLFDEWRYLDHGEPGMDNAKRPLNPAFVLNAPRYRGAEILLTRENFGCGSSREHAPWALEDYGFKAIIAPSFADIFFSNSTKIGLLPVELTEEECHAIAAAGSSEIDLAAQEVRYGDGQVARFELDPGTKHRLLNGLDDIAMTLQQAETIDAYEADRERVGPVTTETVA